VVDAVMLEAVEHQPIVGSETVSVDDAFRHDLRPEMICCRVLCETSSTMRV
jgi:hypothetical protein